MTRREFIELEGATCRNWRWSWAFVNHAKKKVIFGAWDITSQGSSKIILKDRWEHKVETGRKSPAYGEALEYIQLIQDNGYSLWTFPIGHALVDPSQPDGTAKITSFDPVLSEGILSRQGDAWLALSTKTFEVLPDEVIGTFADGFVEGERRPVLVNSIERNQKARAKCLEFFGYQCRVCQFDFLETYGEIGLDFIHVHHINPIGKTHGPIEIDPAKDLLPVCPNCHAMIHRREPPYTVEDIVRLMRETLGMK